MASYDVGNLKTACNVQLQATSPNKFNTVFFKKINSFLAVVVLSRCARAFPSCREWGALSVVVHRLLISVASLAAEHKL